MECFVFLPGSLLKAEVTEINRVITGKLELALTIVKLDFNSSISY